MRSKERVIKALNQEEPDRVPIGEIGIDYPITEKVLGRKTYYRAKIRELKAYWKGKRDLVVESYKRDVVDLVKALDLDIVPVFLVPSKYEKPEKPRFIDKYTFEIDGNVYRYSVVTGDVICIKPREVTLEEIEEQLREPFEIDDSQLEYVRHVIKTLGGTHFILGRGVDGTFPQPGGLQRTLINFYRNPRLIEKAIELSTRRAITIGKRLIEEGVDGVLLGSDYCDNRGPMMSLKHFRRFILPALRRHCEEYHKMGVYVIKHTDGNTWMLLDDMIEAGIDGYQAIQPSAGMDIKKLKEKYGDKITLWGAVECRTLVAGTTEDIKKEVEYNIRYAAPGGGYILGSANSIQVGTRYENYMLMLEIAKKYGRYPIRIKN